MSLRERLERLEVIAKRYPDYWPGWFQYADLIAHSGTHIGYDVSEALAGFQRVVALNPKLVPAWEHIYLLTARWNRPEADRALTRRRELGELGLDNRMFRLEDGVSRAGGAIPPNLDPLADSLAELMAYSPNQFVAQYGPASMPLLTLGFPVAQLDLNRRALSFLTSPQEGIRTALLVANARAWAARGQWDSVLAIMRQAAMEHPGLIGGKDQGVGGIVVAVESYGFAVLGAWVGATSPVLADQRRPAAVRAIASAIPDEEVRADARGRLAWLDGLLGYTRGDRAAIGVARQTAAKSGYVRAQLVDRSLAAFDRALAGDRAGAGRDLAALEQEVAEMDHWRMDFTPHIAVERLAAAQWLHEAGEVEQAARLLRWQETLPWGGGMLWGFSDALDGPTYLVRARLEEARGQPGGARRYYERFLRLYDRPMPTQAHLLEEARSALARLAERADDGGLPSSPRAK